MTPARTAARPSSRSSRHAIPDTVRVLRNEANAGIIATCERLYASARGRLVFVNSSDGQWKCAEVLPMLAVADRYDLVVGRRRHKRYGLRRQVVSGLFNLLPRLLFGVETHDAGSIKLFRREVLDIPLVSRSPFREAERIIRAYRLGYRIGAVDVEHLDRRGGQATGARWRLIGAVPRRPRPASGGKSPCSRPRRGVPRSTAP